MNRHIRLITTATLPLLFTIGCASTDTRNFSTTTDDSDHPIIADQAEQNDVNESVKLAINNMNGYKERMKLEEELTHTQKTTSTTEINTELETMPGEEVTDMTVLIVEEGIELEDTTATLTSTESEEIDQLIEADKAITAPDQTRFFFGFNKTEPDDADKEVLTQHAAYLVENPNVVLVISGHADNRGNKNYNQYLSELRAQNIAKILMAAGVSQGQLRVGGMGDNVPMLDATHWGENRRVELLYRDALMLSSQ